MTPRRDVLERFWEKVDATGECWVWTAATEWGYGRFSTKPKTYVYAHRFSYELHHATQIPAGLQIDHLCRNRACVRPDHLEAVSQHENIVRGNGWAGTKSRQTHCKRGHELTPDNLYRQPSRPNIRICRACDVLRNRNRSVARGEK